MNTIFKTSLVIISLIATISSQVIGSGTISNNVQFKDLDGNSYDLYDLLDGNKFVVLHMTYNTWPSCGPAVAGHNTVYNYFGQNSGDVLIFENNISAGNSKSDFIAWMNDWNAELPGISSDEGGYSLRSAVYGSNPAYGGPKYIIKHDRNFVRSYDLITDLEALGASQTNIQNSQLLPNEFLGKITNITKTGFTFFSSKSDNYSFSFYSSNGKLIEKLNKREIKTGNNNIDLSQYNFAKGLYLLKINTSGKSIFNKIIIK